MYYKLCHQTNIMSSAGHTERAMLYHELEDGMYSVTSYFFAKVNHSDNTAFPVGVSLTPCCV